MCHLKEREGLVSLEFWGMCQNARCGKGPGELGVGGYGLRLCDDGGVGILKIMELKKLWRDCERGWYRGCSFHDVGRVEKRGDKPKCKHHGRDNCIIVELAQLDFM